MGLILSKLKIFNFDNSFKKRFLNGLSWSFVSSVLTQVFSLILMILLARVLARENYGKFLLVQNTLNTFVILAGFGLGSTAVHYIASLKYSYKKKLGRIVALGYYLIILFSLIFSILFLFLPSKLSLLFFKSSELSNALSISAFSVLFNALDSYHKNILIGFEAIREFAIASIGGVFISIPILVCGAFSGDINGVAIGLLISSIIQFLISIFFALKIIKKNEIKIEVKTCFLEFNIIKNFALPTLMASIFVTVSHWICQSLLARQNDGYSEVSLLGISMQWFNAILFLPMIIARVLVPILTETESQKKIGDSKSILFMAVMTNVVLTFPLILIFSLFSDFILKLYGDSYKNESLILIITMFCAGIAAAMHPIGNFIAAKAKMWLGMYMNAAWALVYIILSFFLIKYGAVGVIFSMFIAYVFHSIWVTKWTFIQLNK